MRRLVCFASMETLACAASLFVLVTAVGVAQTPDASPSRSPAPAKAKAASTRPREARVADATGGPKSAEKTENDAARRTGPARPAGKLEPLGKTASGRPTNGRISKGAESLPNDAGQVWREYDLTPYTKNLANVERPEQAVVDWVLRETGTDVWFGSPLGILSADREKLRIYHTPEMQETIKGVYERFMDAPGQNLTVAVKLVTIGSPNWRARALGLMKPVEVRTQGLEAWLMNRENAAILITELKKRSDFREHASPTAPIPNGQTLPLTRRAARGYRKTFAATADGLIAPVMGKIDEGYSLEISPLLAADGETVDCVMRCAVDQIEKLVSVGVDVPFGGQMQRQEIQVPQLVSWNLHERFRWPTRQVLLLSCGVVATPSPDATPAGLPKLFQSTGRADALLFVEIVSTDDRGRAPPLPERSELGGSGPVSLAPTSSADARARSENPPRRLTPNVGAVPLDDAKQPGAEQLSPTGPSAPGANPAVGAAPGGISRGRY